MLPELIQKMMQLTNFAELQKFTDKPEELRIEGLTTRNGTGDFTKVKEPNSVFRKTYSINKNVMTLTNLIKYVKSFIPSGQTIHKNLPLLLIDDEADNASINTKKKRTMTLLRSIN